MNESLLPSLFQLPTLDDVKDEMTKLTTDKLRVGQIVEIGTLDGTLPKFASKPQLKTFGLSGTSNLVPAYRK